MGAFRDIVCTVISTPRVVVLRVSDNNYCSSLYEKLNNYNDVGR